MTVLVTGGAGFIGGHLCEAFLREGHDAVALDNFEPYYDVGIKEHAVEEARGVAASSVTSWRQRPTPIIATVSTPSTPWPTRRTRLSCWAAI